MAVSAEHYARQLAALLPPGVAMAAEPDSEMAALLLKLGDWLARAGERAALLQAEASPHHTLQLLPEWEASLGLPDSCSVGTPTLAERRAALNARLTDAGGARTPRFLQIATALGYPGATVARFKIHTCEQSCEEPLRSEAWRFSWVLAVPSSVTVTESTCESAADDPLRVWGNTQLNCIMARECPQPSTVLITYGA